MNRLASALWVLLSTGPGRLMLIVCLLFGLGAMGRGATVDTSGRTNAAVVERQDHVLVRLSGKVDKQMTRTLDRVIRQQQSDQRRIVLSLHSDGGLVSEGEVIIERLKRLRRTHELETLVEEGRHCASMCVPIFVTGAHRMAHPKARFMFHSVRVAAANPFIRPTGAEIRRIEEQATEDLFDGHLRASGVNERWLEQLRASMGRADAWFSAKDLHDRRVGVVDQLVAAGAR